MVRRLAVAACLWALTACGAGPGVDAAAPGATVVDTATPSPGQSPGPRPVVLDFTGAVPGPLPDDALSGSWPPGIRVEVVSHGGGRIDSTSGPKDGAGAVRLPAYDPRGRRFAVLRVSTVRGLLSPGERDFTFGAEVMIDATSSGTDADDGDNVVQRGLHGPDAQFKLQVDRGIASCRVAGDEGEVIARLGRRLESEVWHRIRCTRSGDTVTVEATALVEGAEEQVGASSQRGPIGAVEFGAATPLSVGGKLAVAGTIAASSTDQLNGAVARVSFELLG